MNEDQLLYERDEYGNKKMVRCDCGCNVFRLVRVRLKVFYYKCNACNAIIPGLKVEENES
jgi:hypothetical protein